VQVVDTRAASKPQAPGLPGKPGAAIWRSAQYVPRVAGSLLPTAPHLRAALDFHPCGGILNVFAYPACHSILVRPPFCCWAATFLFGRPTCGDTATTALPRTAATPPPCRLTSGEERPRSTVGHRCPRGEIVRNDVPETTSGNRAPIDDITTLRKGELCLPLPSTNVDQLLVPSYSPAQLRKRRYENLAGGRE
jgi:hypothetical protein